jgi:hypothetical protein
MPDIIYGNNVTEFFSARSFWNETIRLPVAYDSLNDDTGRLLQMTECIIVMHNYRYVVIKLIRPKVRVKCTTVKITCLAILRDFKH